MRATPIRRIYNNFRGVDFTSDSSVVNISRSPDALNVWKNYSDTQGACIETRPGYQLLHQFEGGNVNGLHVYNNKAYVHVGTKLYEWSNFPSSQATTSVLKADMNNAKTSYAIFNDTLYMLDGEHYLVFDGTLRDATQGAYIPTTTVGRKPAGGGEMLEDVNVLSEYRINSFIGDGTSVDYYLDTQLIDSVTEVKVNGSTVTNYTVNTTAGKVTFSTAPSAPPLGNDNVTIKFRKQVPGYADRINHCTKMVVFDNRIFYAGNLTYKNAIFHSSLNNPQYISDLDYYEDGTDESAIKDIVVGNNILWVLKEPNQQNETIFYHTPIDIADYGKVYPVQQGNIATGCNSCAINYSDDIVFLSKQGLEGITGDINTEQLLTHRSSLVDSKLTNSNNYSDAMMTEWAGYLLILVNSKVFLADIRQMYQSVNGYEYEWYYWDLNGEISLLKEYKGNLYIGAENGSVFILEGTNDNGQIINSYWTTPLDDFDVGNHLKTTNKRGGVAKIKTIPNGKIKIAEKTNRKDERFITSKSSTGFDYTNIDYSNFAYTTKNDSYIVYKIKEKKFINISLKFYSDELDKPFGLYEAIIEGFVGGYVKR
jgi:hypothetical protein